MKLKTDKVGSIVKVRFGRYESGAVVSYGDYLLCANTFTVVQAQKDADINSPGLELNLSEESVIYLWESTLEDWNNTKNPQGLVVTGLSFKCDNINYTLLRVGDSRIFVAVESNFVIPLSKTHNFQILPPISNLGLARGAGDAVDFVDVPLILACNYIGVAALITPARIPQKILFHLGKDVLE